ncbi:major facilitator superfamily domain-containing protein [Whalleya microplaca]|nr:major facilitator superfamily domain-containing protein [Whalleya microplaca]
MSATQISESNTEPSIEKQPVKNEDIPVQAGNYGLQFWLIVVAIILSAIVSALDGSAVSTALPTIVAELELGPNYVWTVNIYFLTTAAFQPLLGQLSDLWGRRWVFISTVAIFVLGSGLCGGASTAAMFIAARGVQGVGAGGINMMVDLIICDLVPLRDRGKYMGIIFGVATIFAALGPLFGGALTGAGAWRWIFWLNLPLGGLCIGILLIWLRLSHRREGSFLHRIRRVDWIGTGIIVGSTVSILWALAYGGSLKPWSDSGVIAALVVGHAGLGLFIVWEATPWSKEPLIPLRLFANRTSAAAFFLTFTNCLFAIWVVYMLPVYFQAVLGSDPLHSGIRLLPYVCAFPFAAAISGNVMAKIGRYRPIHLVGFAMCTLACGLSSILDENSHDALWAVFEIFFAVGIGAPITCLLPAVQAKLSDKDTASSTAAWAFIRSLGTIWGISIPAAIFNDRFEQLRYLIEDEQTRNMLGGGQAYAQAASSFTNTLTGITRDQVIQVYSMSLQRVWQLSIIFAGISFLVVFLEREVVMRKELETDFGLEKEKKQTP